MNVLYSQAEEGFQNSQAAVLPKRQDLAINGSLQVSPDWAVKGQLLAYNDLTLHTKKEVAQLGVVHQVNPVLTLEANPPVSE